MYIRLVQDFGLECEVAQHLAKSYGDRAFAVAKMAALTGKSHKINLAVFHFVSTLSTFNFLFTVIQITI